MLSNQTYETNVKNSSIEILTYVVKINHRKNKNKMVDKFRDDILQATLRAYSPDTAPQH